MLGKDTKAYQEIQKNLHRLTDGIVVSIDPSIGSTSSMPGYAVYVSGELKESGIIEIDSDKPKWTRLQSLAYNMRKLYTQWDPDILVYEDIPSQRHGGGNANAHASLLNAVGVILSISGPDGYVGLHPMSWKKMVRPTYVKGDKEDAEEMGWIAINLAHHIEETDPPGRKRYGQNRKR